MRATAESYRGRTLNAERGGGVEGCPIGAIAAAGGAPTSIQRGFDHASDSMHVGAGVGDGPPKCVFALACRLPSTEHQPAARVATVIQPWAYVAAENLPIRARPTGGRPQSLARPRGVHSLLYFVYTCISDLFIRGVIYLAENILR